LRSGAERRAVVLVAVCWLALALHALGAGDIVGDDEAREAGIVQDVVAGHWLWPRFDRETLPDKPVLYHWLAAVPCALAGFSEAAVRLPSALAGAAVVAWTGLFGATLLGPEAGVLAAAAVATMPALFDHARVARPDVLLVLCLSVALGLAFRWWREGHARDATAALAALGLATLAKGPVAPALFALTLGGFLAWQGELGRLRRLATPAGVATFVVLGLGWYAVALAGWGDVFVREHLIGRYARNLAGGLVAGRAYSPKPLAYHLLFYPEHLPLVPLPWTPAVVVTLWRAWRRGGFADPRLRFLVCWTLAPVVAFTPAEWKLRYYLLPALPALALLAAPALAALAGTAPARPDVRRAVVALVVAGIVVAVGLAAVPAIPLSASDRANAGALVAAFPDGARGVAVATGAVAGALALGVAWRAWSLLATLTAVAVVAWMAVGAPAVERAVSRRDSLKTFAREVAARHPPPESLVFYGEPIRPIVVYVGRPVPRTDGVPTAGAVVATEPAARRLARAGVVALPELSGEGRVGNLGRARVLLLAIVGHATSR
jgi:4-amino-4-deoxy-L-arabinose transferase-like glycosyltransferase